MRVGMIGQDPMPESKFATAKDFYDNNVTIRRPELDDDTWAVPDDFAYRVDFFPGGGQTLLNYEMELEVEEELYDY